VSGGLASRRAAIGLAIVTAGALTLCARMETCWVPLLFVALVPWLAAVDAAPTFGRALASAVALTLAFVAGVFWWFGVAVATYASIPLPLGFLVLLALTPVLAPQFVVATGVRWRLRRSGRPGLAPLGFAAAWIGAEWVVPKLFGDTLGHGLYPSRVLRQAADLAGVPGLTVAILAVNECALVAARAAGSGAPRRGRIGRTVGAIATALVVVGALGLYGRRRLATLAAAEATTDPVTVAIVQADIGQYARLAAETGTYEAVRRILDTHFALARSVLADRRPDLMVWPETVYPTTFGSPKSPDGAAFDRELAGFVARERVPLVFGSYDTEGGHEYNAAVVLEREPDGNVTWDAYRKATLFPLIEYVPRWLDRPAVRRLLPWMGTWTPGPGAAVLLVRIPDGRWLRIAPLVCYDATHPALAAEAARRGAELLVTLSNDSWFDVGAGPLLHLVVSAFRSVETRRPQVRSTNTGISAVVTAAGDVTARIGVHERGVAVARVAPGRGPPTVAVRWAAWLGPAAAALALLALAAGGVRPRRGRR
jgi:apolipoprotein N-acyltransferase